MINEIDDQQTVADYVCQCSSMAVTELARQQIEQGVKNGGRGGDYKDTVYFIYNRSVSYNIADL